MIYSKDFPSASRYSALMDMPRTVLCEKCGAESRVVTRNVNEKEIEGAIPVKDHRQRDGFKFRIDCPHCGERVQFLAPPP